VWKILENLNQCMQIRSLEKDLALIHLKRQEIFFDGCRSRTLTTAHEGIYRCLILYTHP
jgi:hypothetical protein